MNNPNPFVPKGSLLEQQSQRRSRLKLAVFCVLAVAVTGLTAMLIQGCKREQPPVDNTLSPVDQATNNIPLDNTNLLTPGTNTMAPLPLLPPPTNTVTPLPPVTPPVTPEVGGSDYVVVKGDSLAKIAKKNGVTLKAIQAANPGVVPTKLKIGQKLVIPAGGKPAADATAPAVAAAAGSDAGTGAYAVKSGDTLSKIAKKNGVSLKALEAANPTVDPAHIKVGQKLKIPAKAEAAPAAPVAPVPAVDNTPAPMLPPPTAPATAPAK